jgi:hypothetical protein
MRRMRDLISHSGTPWTGGGRGNWIPKKRSPSCFPHVCDNLRFPGKGVDLQLYAKNTDDASTPSPTDPTPTSHDHGGGE